MSGVRWEAPEEWVSRGHPRLRGQMGPPSLPPTSRTVLVRDAINTKCADETESPCFSSQQTEKQRREQACFGRGKNTKRPNHRVLQNIAKH